VKLDSFVLLINFGAVGHATAFKSPPAASRESLPAIIEKRDNAMIIKQI